MARAMNKPQPVKQPTPEWRGLFTDIAYLQRAPFTDLELLCVGNGYNVIRRPQHRVMVSFCFTRDFA